MTTQSMNRQQAARQILKRELTSDYPDPMDIVGEEETDGTSRSQSSGTLFKLPVVSLVSIVSPNNHKVKVTRPYLPNLRR
jgi:hypothetical protein